MFSAVLFVLIDCQFARCPHLSGGGRCANEWASADKSPTRDVKKRLDALFTIEFSIGPYPVLPRCPYNLRWKVPTRTMWIFTTRLLSRISRSVSYSIGTSDENAPRITITKSIRSLKINAIYANYCIIHKLSDNEQHRVFFENIFKRYERARLIIRCQ